MKFDDYALKLIGIFALVAIAIGTGFIALWLAQIVDLLGVIANKNYQKFYKTKGELMNILFVCTDNFTRSVIAEFCMKDYLKTTNNARVNVASTGIRANSDISRYSKIHFNILGEMGIDTSDFKRTQFDETCFEKFHVIIGMSELHRDYIKQQYNRDIFLFNELFNGQQTPVNIGSPDRVDFVEQMNQLVVYVNNAIPYLLRNIEKESVEQTGQVSTSEVNGRLLF